MKKIIILCPSPYLNIKNSRIVKDLIQSLQKNNLLALCCWGHNSLFFPPDENNVSFYEDSNGVKVQLYPVPENVSSGAVYIYNVINTLKPDIVMSVGSMEESSILGGIKALDKEAFKWISILAQSTVPVSGEILEYMSYCDKVVSLNDFTTEYLSNNKVGCETVRFLSSAKFFNKNQERKREIVCFCKNSKESNLGAVFGLAKKIKDNNLDIKINLITNKDDNGEYNLDFIVDDLKIRDIIIFPDKSSTIYYGLEDEEINDIMNNSQIIIDASICSCSGISIIEGISAGCIPLTNHVGIYKEFVNSSYMESNSYMGELGFNYSISNIDDLFEKVKYIFLNIEVFKNQSKEKLFMNYKGDFLLKIESIIEELGILNNAAKIYSF